MRTDYPTTIELLAWLFCAFISRGILDDWVSFPLLDLSRFAFTIWFVPVAVYWFYPYAPERRYANQVLLGAGIVISLGGLLGELNALKHLGFALATAGMIRWSWGHLFWLITAVSWIPASAYVVRALPFDLVMVGRLLVAGVGAAMSVWLLFAERTLTWSEHEAD